MLESDDLKQVEDAQTGQNDKNKIKKRDVGEDKNDIFRGKEIGSESFLRKNTDPFTPKIINKL